jgi:hypothetical protein
VDKRIEIDYKKAGVFLIILGLIFLTARIEDLEEKWKGVDDNGGGDGAEGKVREGI